MRFWEQRELSEGERAVIPVGKHGPSLRSVGLLASRARLIVDCVRFRVDIKGLLSRQRRTAAPNLTPNPPLFRKRVLLEFECTADLANP